MRYRQITAIGFKVLKADRIKDPRDLCDRGSFL